MSQPRAGAAGPGGGGNPLISALEATLQQLTELEAAALAPGAQQQARLVERTNALVASLQRVDAARGDVADVTLPPEVVIMIDAGLNPDLHSVDLFALPDRGLVARSQASRGKTVALARLHGGLVAQAQRAYPHLADAYAQLAQPPQPPATSAPLAAAPPTSAGRRR